MNLSLLPHADGLNRCSWCGEGAALADYQAYHDDEWGRPVGDGSLAHDQRLFEKLVLEGFQSGLSWLTILRKRQAFRAAFGGLKRGLDFAAVARFGAADITRLLGDAGIVRHRGKIEAALHNAERALALRAEAGSIAAFVWQFEPAASARPRRLTPQVAATLGQTPESLALSKALKQRGWKFVGPTTMYAFMQSMGLVNDHLEGCHARAACESDRAAFKRPALRKPARV
jgi:DNA-3-methyladenine glycosylase I